MKTPSSTPAKVVGTLVYLRRQKGDTQEIVLALKAATPKAVKRGLAGKRNGYGGGLEEKDNGSLARCGAREVFEESGVIVNHESLEKIAVINFHNSWGDYECHYFVVDTENADPRATQEMPDPQWFSVDNPPLHNMMESDKLLLLRLLTSDPSKRERLIGEIWHDDVMHIIKHEIQTVQKLP